MNSDDALRHLAEIKSVEAEKHARDSANHPELSGSKVPKYSAAAKASSAAAQYAQGIAGLPAGGPELLATVSAAPRGVDEPTLIHALQVDAAAASVDPTVPDAAAQKIASAAGKLAAAYEQDLRWVESHKGKDPRADAEAAEKGI